MSTWRESERALRSGATALRVWDTAFVEELRGFLRERPREFFFATHLDLSHCNLGDEGVRVLCRAFEDRRFPHLHELDLTFNGIGDAGGRRLARALARESVPVEILHLGGNGLGNGSALKFKKMLKKNAFLRELGWEYANPRMDLAHRGALRGAQARQLARVPFLALCAGTVSSAPGFSDVSPLNGSGCGRDGDDYVKFRVYGMLIELARREFAQEAILDEEDLTVECVSGSDASRRGTWSSSVDSLDFCVFQS